MYKKLYILIIALFLLVPIINAKQIMEAQTLGGIDIQIPRKQYIEQNQAYTLHLHVFNATSGKTLKNDTTDCFAHVYSVHGSHILEEDLGWDSNDLEFKLDVGGGNFSELGEHNFIIYCNNSESGGAVSSSFEINVEGAELTTASMILYSLMILLILGFIFVSIVGIWNSENLISKSLYGVMIYLLLIALFFGIWDLSYKFTELVFLTWFLRFCFLFMIWSFIPFFFLTMYFMFVQLAKAKAIQQLIDKGMMEDEATKRVMGKK